MEYVQYRKPKSMWYHIAQGVAFSTLIAVLYVIFMVAA